MFGRIMAIVKKPPLPSNQYAWVMGDVIDSWLDAFGYPTDLISELHDARRAANMEAEFVAAVSRYLARTEAEWVWKWTVISRRDILL